MFIEERKWPIVVIDDLVNVIPEDRLSALTDDRNSGEPDEAVLQTAIDLAAEEMDAYLAVVARLPLSTVPDLLRSLNADLAVCRLFRRVNTRPAGHLGQGLVQRPPDLVRPCRRPPKTRSGAGPRRTPGLQGPVSVKRNSPPPCWTGIKTGKMHIIQTIEDAVVSVLTPLAGQGGRNHRSVCR